MGRQVGDFLTYILLPLCCVALPYAVGQALIRDIAQRGWLLKARSAAALDSARNYVQVSDEAGWRARWRLVELTEARDLWFVMVGRRKAVLRSIQQRGLPPATDRFVLIGMHWGPSVLALQLFRDAGLAPRFVYRQIDPDTRRVAPFHYLYLCMLVRYIRGVCAGRDIAVPGALKQLEAAAAEPGTPVILLDAPTTRPDRSIFLRVGDLVAEFNSGGPEWLVTGKSTVVLYSLSFNAAGARELRCSEPFTPESTQALMQQFSHFMAQHLADDSAQWRLWHAADQLFRNPGNAAVDG
jgi:hypothetical protein